MTAISPVQQRRARMRQSVATRQVITFSLRDEWFALPIESVREVLPLGRIYGDPKGTGLSLTIFQHRELTVVDVGRRIFGDRPLSIPSDSSSNLWGAEATTTNLPAIVDPDAPLPPQRFLIVVESSSGEQVGFPIDQPPAVKRFPLQAFSSIPATYASAGNVRCISSMMLPEGDSPPIFAIDPDQLVAEVWAQNERERKTGV